MLTFFLLLSVITIVTYILHTRTRKLLGTSDAPLLMKMKDDSWIAETQWVDQRTGQLHSIVTSCDPIDGVVSVYDHYKMHYHSKQPLHNRTRILRYHREARNWFFNRMELDYLRGMNSRKHYMLRPVLYMGRTAQAIRLGFPHTPVGRFLSANHVGVKMKLKAMGSLRKLSKQDIARKLWHPAYTATLRNFQKTNLVESLTSLRDAAQSRLLGKAMED